MRNINTLVIHCSATKEGQDVSVETIRSWHLARGWADIGYHFVVERDGSVKAGRPIEIAGAHVEGHNSRSIGVCYIGGLDKDGHSKDTRTPEQKVALRQVVNDMKAKFPSITTVCGHRDFPGVKKDCPCFDVRTEL